MKQNFSFAQFAQNRKFYAKCNFLGKLSKIDILSLELNNWRFIPYIKKILTYDYDNDYTALNWLLPVTKSLNQGTQINKIAIRECETWQYFNPIK